MPKLAVRLLVIKIDMRIGLLSGMEARSYALP
jgi:hypothetical protein